MTWTNGTFASGATMIVRTSSEPGPAVRRTLVIALLVAVAAVGAGCGSTTKNSGAATTTGDASAVEVLVNAGISQASAHMLSEAITTFEDVLLISPKNVYALYNLGVIDQMEGNTAGALSYYDEALSADGTYAPALYNKAGILEVSDLDAALALYQQIATLNPKAATAYLQIAFIYAKQGNHLKAEEARTKAISLDSSLSKYTLPAKCAQARC
jgi:tetratricopeptide (TPR) repeat protein